MAAPQSEISTPDKVHSCGRAESRPGPMQRWKRQGRQRHQTRSHRYTSRALYLRDWQPNWMSIVSCGSHLDCESVICIFKSFYRRWELQMDQIVGAHVYGDLLHLITASQLQACRRIIFCYFD